MFGHHFLIQNFFYVLALLSPQSDGDTSQTLQSSFEVVVTTGHYQSSGIIELICLPIQLVKTSQSNKLPYVHPFEGKPTGDANSYDSKLLYFNVGDTIELELTTTTIIFPFHCFT